MLAGLAASLAVSLVTGSALAERGTGSTGEGALALGHAADDPALNLPAIGTAVLISVSSGEAFLGTLVSADANTIMIDHPTLGRLQMPRAQVVSVALAPVSGNATGAPASGSPAISAVPVPPPAPAAPPAPAPDAKPAPIPDPESFWDGWKRQVDVGVNGAAGNSENFNLRAAISLTRTTSEEITALTAQYVYATNDGDKSTDRGEVALRNDWLIGSPWRVYAIGKAEYDQFQDWEWRVSAVGGVGYEFIKNDDTLLLGRAGFGLSREFGGGDGRIKPEANLGLDFEHKLDERQRIYASVDYYPSVLNFAQDYRIISKAGYEIVVDPKNNISLKLGVEDRYESEPSGGRTPNDFLYFATLSLGF